MTPSLRIFLAAVTLVGLAACKNKQSQIAETGIIVDISSDLAVPQEINQVRLITTDSQGTEILNRTLAIGEEAGRRPLPLREGIYPLHETDKPIHIQVLGLSDGTPVVSNSATLSFQHGQLVVLPLPLFAACRPATRCPAFETCKANGKCGSDFVDAAGLPRYTPNLPLDAATNRPDVAIVVDAPDIDTRPDSASDRQPDVTRDTGNDAPLATGTTSATETATASASGSGTGQSTDSTTGTVTGSATTSTATGTGTGATGTVLGTDTASGSTTTATGTGTSKTTGGATETRTGTGSGNTGTGTGTGTGGASTVTASGTGTGTGTGSGTVSTATGSGTGTGTGGASTITASGTGTGTGSGTAGTSTSTGTGTGTGTGNAAGVRCNDTGECQAGLTCLDHVCCTVAECPQCRNCGAIGTCSIEVVDDEDTTGATCSGIDTCNAAGVCKKKPGESCNPANNECTTGASCTDSRCCIQTCGVCQQCTGVGGICVAVIGREDSDSCSGGNACDASATCKKKDGQPCTAAAECVTGRCNLINTCGPYPSCVGLAASCGPMAAVDCCATLEVPGGTFYRSYDGIDFTNMTNPATVASFYLDRFEVTVGRFRKFVEAGKGTVLNPPAAGDGAHPEIPGSGWDSAWNTNLAASTAALTTKIMCSLSWSTWTDTAEANESKPINCLDWYTAFAFCAWDGGRLPTEAEWNYAAAGGDEQRYYPWSKTSMAIDDRYAVYCEGAGCSTTQTQNVGSKSPTGDGKWGQSDLAGNVWEWTLDGYSAYVNPCSNCADLTSQSERVSRGGGFSHSPLSLRSALRDYINPKSLASGLGVRCARPRL